MPGNEPTLPPLPIIEQFPREVNKDGGGVALLVQPTVEGSRRGFMARWQPLLLPPTLLLENPFLAPGQPENLGDTQELKARSNLKIISKRIYHSICIF